MNPQAASHERLEKDARAEAASPALHGEPSPPTAIGSSTNSGVVTPFRNRGGRYSALQLGIALLSAILVGTPLTILQRPQYRCVSTLDIAGEPTPRQLTRYRQELLDHAREQFAGTDELGPTSRRWFVDTDGRRQLQLGVDFSSPSKGIAKVRQVAETYCKRMAAQAAGALATRSEAELILSDRIATLRNDLGTADFALNTAESALPQIDPTDNHLVLIDRWVSLDAQFASSRTHFVEARDTVARMTSEPNPRHAVVPKEDRDKAFNRDRALAQDLRELEVNLTELKLHLLNVWQTSAGPLEPLTMAVDDLLAVVTPERAKSIRESDRKRLNTVRSLTLEYKTVLAMFEQTWHREFTALRSMDTDPRTEGILNVFQSVRASLRDFLFDGSKRLTSLRTQVRSFSLGSADSARYHVLRSDLTRAFQTVETAHHRFEFAAEAIETPENFRLDAALLGARGLRRRSRERITTIEKRLQTQALEQARQRRLVDLRKAEEQVEQRRGTLDGFVEQLVTLQEQINSSANDLVAYHQAAKAQSVAATRRELLQEQVQTVDARLHGLQTRREMDASASSVTIVSCKTLGSSVNVRERIRVGAIGGCLTFLVVFLGQWFVGRRRA